MWNNSSPSNRSLRKVKICILGPPNAGKSSLILQFVKHAFLKDNEPTIGTAYMSTVLNLKNFDLQCNIWDTSGQEIYKSLAPMYYRGAVAAVVVYDITERHHFDDIKMWVGELKKFGSPHVEIAIVGNKFDLHENRKISTEEGKLYANSIDALFYETSAKRSYNVDEVFYELANKIPEKYMIVDETKMNNLQVKFEEKASKNNTPDGCCG